MLSRVKIKSLCSIGLEFQMGLQMTFFFFICLFFGLNCAKSTGSLQGVILPPRRHLAMFIETFLVVTIGKTLLESSSYRVGNAAKHPIIKDFPGPNEIENSCAVLVSFTNNLPLFPSPSRAKWKGWPFLFFMS